MARERDMIHVFQNLIANAVMFRAVHVSDAVTISIADNSQGVDESHLELVFGIFERVCDGPYPELGSDWPSAGGFSNASPVTSGWSATRRAA
jgi:hypothetical protein